MKDHPDRKVKWCKAHPEGRSKTTWSREDWGNHIADRVANGGNPLDEIWVEHHAKVQANHMALHTIDTWYWGGRTAKSFSVTHWRKHNTPALKPLSETETPSASPGGRNHYTMECHWP